MSSKRSETLPPHTPGLNWRATPMHIRRHSLILLCCLLLAAPHALAQGPAMQRLQTLLEDVERAFTAVGKKAEQFIGPGLGLGEEKPAAYSTTVRFEDHYPVGPAPTVAISNEFGTIRVQTWDNRVVQVSAEIRAGADSEALAEEIAQGVQVSVAADQELVEVRSFLPEMRRDASMVSISVDYTITVPAAAHIVTDNAFGDTVIHGIHGLVAVEAQYGSLELENIRGRVKARMRGEFTLQAANLAQGGAFDLRGTQAEFSGISGALQVSNHRGSVLLRDLAPDAEVEVESVSGPIFLLLPAGATPELTASAQYGEVKSALPLTRSRQAHKAVARLAQADTRQRILLNTTFADVHVDTVVREGQQAPQPQGDHLFSDPEVLEQTLSPEDSVVINATSGNIRVQGSDGDVLRIQATRLVWASQAGQAGPALRALEIHTQHTGAQFSVSTTAKQDMARLGAGVYSVDLLIECPRTLPLHIRAEKGSTVVMDYDGPVTVAQAVGDIRVENVRGDLDLATHNGDIAVTDCVGAVKTGARYGNVQLTRILGPVTSENLHSNTLVDGVRGDMHLRGSGGDVRIIALDGLAGGLDVFVNNGNVRMLLDPYKTDASLSVRTEQGEVHSAIALNGTIEANRRDYAGRLGSGEHRVRLETFEGDILLDGAGGANHAGADLP